MPNATDQGPAVVVKGLIGPFDPMFHSTVGRYYRSSPTSQQAQCLQQFFAELRRRPVNVPYIITEFLLVYTCGHVVTFSRDGRRVIDLAQGAVPPGAVP
jgi:hypothetical protein